MTPHQNRQERRKIAGAIVGEVWYRGGNPDDIAEQELATALTMDDVPYVAGAVIRRQRQPPQVRSSFYERTQS